MVYVFSFDHSKKIEKQNYFISLFVVYLSETLKAKLGRLEDTCSTAKLYYSNFSYKAKFPEVSFPTTNLFTANFPRTNSHHSSLRSP